MYAAASFLFFTATWATAPFETYTWETKKGVHVIFYPAMEVPMLDLSIAFAAGSAYDQDAFGLSTLTTRLLNQGSNGLNANIIAERLAQTGAQYGGGSAQDMAVLSLKTLVRPDALQQAIETFSSILTHPDFPQEAFEHEKNQQLMAISETEESPEAIANQTFFQVLYKTHPYGHPIIGDRNHLDRITNKQVRDFYNQYFVSQNAILVMVGAIDKATAHRLSERVTEDLPKGVAAKPIPIAEPLTEAMDIEVHFPSKQTLLRLGQLGVVHQDKDYFPLMVGNYILGGGMDSRLSLELREKRGLTYGVSSQFVPLTGKGPFLISFSTKNSQAKMAIDSTRKQLLSFITLGPNAHELTAAKQYLMGSFPISLSSNRNIADVLLKMSFYHLPEDYLKTYLSKINAVSIQDIKNAFQHLINPNKLLQVSVGKR